jgi:hypothetical protein
MSNGSLVREFLAVHKVSVYVLFSSAFYAKWGHMNKEQVEAHIDRYERDEDDIPPYLIQHIIERRRGGNIC